jgi:hypothetical protein
VAEPVEIEWSLDALSDLDRFAAFLHDGFPDLAARIANALQYRYDGHSVLMLRVLHSREAR